MQEPTIDASCPMEVCNAPAMWPLAACALAASSNSRIRSIRRKASTLPCGPSPPPALEFPVSAMVLLPSLLRDGGATAARTDLIGRAAGTPTIHPYHDSRLATRADGSRLGAIEGVGRDALLAEG